MNSISGCGLGRNGGGGTVYSVSEGQLGVRGSRALAPALSQCKLLRTVLYVGCRWQQVAPAPLTHVAGPPGSHM